MMNPASWRARFRRWNNPRCIDAISLLAGAVTAFGFAPFDVFPFAILGPATLFVTWSNVSAARAAWRGFLYGIGLFGLGVSWVYVSLHTFGNMPAPLAGIAVLVFVAVLALYPALFGAFQARFRSAPAGLRYLALLPAGWVLFEWVRGWFLSGFPWLNLGYSQMDTPLSGFAAWLGVYGVSLAVAISAGVLAASWSNRRRWMLYGAIFAVVWVVGALAKQYEWATPTRAPMPVALIQANVELAVKWQPEHRQRIIDTYVALSERARGARLIVWPESAVPGFFHVVGPTLTERLRRLHDPSRTAFIIGAVELDAERRAYYNSVFVVGDAPAVYRKRHLVPFGEFLPLSSVFGWLLQTLEIPMSNFSAGSDAQATIRVAGETIGVSVCYEDAFGEDVARALPEATLLVNVSEDAWFGNSFAPHQRLQMARMRALETARPMLRAANTGPSAIIDHRGVVTKISPQFQPYELQGEVQPMTGATPYVRYGNGSILALIGVLFAAAVFRRFR